MYIDKLLFYDIDCFEDISEKCWSHKADIFL